MISFFFPEGLLFFAAIVLAASGLAVQAAPALIGLAPVVIWVAGILIGWRFNRSRLVFALVVLALANRTLLLLGSRPGCGLFVHQATSLLVPLNLVGIFLIRERGIMGGWGLGRLLAILLQPLALATLYLTFPAAMAAFFDYPLLTFPVLTSAPLPQPTLLAFGTALLLFWLSLLRRRGILENGFFWATLTAGTGLLVSPEPQAPVYFGMAGLILIVAVIESVYSMAFRDELTGLSARRALNEAMMRLRGKYAVAMLDIDYFKKFNDTYGHDVGDQALCMVAAKMAKVGGGGRAFRYGGEEFTILFPGKSAREAAFFLEELRGIIATAGFIIRGKNRPRIKPKKPRDDRGSRQKVSITVSIGVAEAGGRTPDPQEVLEAADQALYQAKKMGRNQVVF